MSRAHRHQAPNVQERAGGLHQLDCAIRIDPGFLRLAGDVDFDQNRLRWRVSRDRLRHPDRIDCVDERKPVGRQARLVGLQMADQMPPGSLDGLHLGQGLLNSVLTQLGKSSIQRGQALGGGESLRYRDYGYLVRIPTCPLDLLANYLKALGDAHRIATMAPKRVPSGKRRCDGKR